MFCVAVINLVKSFLGNNLFSFFSLPPPDRCPLFYPALSGEGLVPVNSSKKLHYLVILTKLSYPIQIRWADIDANRHLRHSVYYDYGAAVRMQALTEKGLTVKKLEELHIGPVLFREEAVFKREIVYEDNITLTLEVLKASADYSRWSLQHQFVKADGTLAAIVTLDGAWIDLVKRKLAVPDQFIRNVFANFPKSQNFEEIPLRKTGPPA